jgi:hypothetical protein
MTISGSGREEGKKERSGFRIGAKTKSGESQKGNRSEEAPLCREERESIN